MSRSLPRAFSSLRTRIIAAFTTLVLILVAGLLTVVTIRTSDEGKKQGFLYGRELASRYAGEVKVAFTDKMTLAETLASSSATTKAHQALPSRRVSDDVHCNLLAKHPELLGVWTGWEPNAFDGQDAKFRNAEGHDGTGRYVPYLYRNGDDIKLSPLVDYDKPGAGDYYLLTKADGQAW